MKSALHFLMMSHDYADVAFEMSGKVKSLRCLLFS